MQVAVVSSRELEPGIVQVVMEDRASRNTFSRDLIVGLMQVFAQIADNPSYKVVILTGYDSYFATGGTRDGLLALQAGKAKFSDLNLYRAPLDCRIPVIAAMQGHGVGGGFVLGLFCDFPILSRESIYTTNFMRYGFTPGMGATAVVPRKVGLALGHEMLLSARSYRGAELEARGVPFQVVPRTEVLGAALKLAREVAEKPRHSLIVLKDHLVAELRSTLPAIVEQEVIMHEQTFSQPEVRERILQLFGG